MAHREEIIAAVLALWGTDHLTGGRVVPWGDLEQRLEVDLTGESSIESAIRFLDPEKDTSRPPAVWLQDLANRMAARLALLPPSVIEGEREPASVGGTPVAEHTLHAFAGTGGLLLCAEVEDALELHRTQVGVPPQTTLTVGDVLAFVDGQPEAEALKESLLWEDEHNLHLTDGADWFRFVEALVPEHAEELVRTMDRCVSNTRFQQGEADAWYALKERHENPQRAWQFAFVRAGTTTAPIPPADVAAQTRRLETALTEIEAFAEEIDAAYWADWFQQALDLLHDAELPPWFARAFGDAALDEPSRRLIAASIQADVFGGMGSWNDMVPDDTDRYETLSTALFDELKPGLVTAVNAAYMT